ncbi:MAG: acyltransferase [Lachnospiraceae bacterium]|nr:acyltransferase [Lachnospiraceae bacterium]
MRKYYSSLDLLRFLAALAVAFFFHYVIVFGASPTTDNVVTNWINIHGGYVVELFFVVSGFAMYLAYSSRIREGKKLFGEYLVDRVIRLFPTLVISVVLTAIPMWIGYALWDESISNDSYVSLMAILLNLFGLNGGTAVSFFSSVNGPSWYIAVLMICYILFFAIIKNCKGSKAAENVCFLFIILIGVFFYMNPTNAPFLFTACTRGYIFFFIGTFIAQLQSRVKTLGNVILCCISILMPLMYMFAKKHNLFMNESLEIGLFLVVPLVLFFINFKPLEFISNNKVVKFLGGISFGIFMWNLPVFIWVRFINRLGDFDFDYGSITVYLIIVLINIAAGVLSYLLIDKAYTKFLKSKMYNKSDSKSETKVYKNTKAKAKTKADNSEGETDDNQ